MQTLPVLGRRFLSLLGLWPAYLLAFMLIFSSQPARADIWGYLDPAGVAHFAPERLDARYEIYFRSHPAQDAVAALTACTMAA